MQLRHARGTLNLAQPAVMGVLNVTPDSFSDGGKFLDPARALEHALRLVAEGALIIDIGGESTRPGATPVATDEELRRVIPIIRTLAAQSPVLISVDTSNPQVIEQAIDAGAGLINDVRALRGTGALAAVARSGAAVCLMHMRGEPPIMQRLPVYQDVRAEVRGQLQERLAACVAAGIDAGRLCIDPGFGFGKTVAHNLELLRHLADFTDLGVPVMAGLSRKSMLATLTGRAPEERLAGSIALACVAVLNGARIIRAHDVAATLDAVRVVQAVMEI
ncbi:MAG: dihydropteroate synthase [Steroidobacteraceae bacterium]